MTKLLDLPKVTRPSRGSVHLWWLALDECFGTEQELAETLSAEEQQRMRRTRAGVVRQRFVVARASLRAILAAYLGCATNEVRFRYGVHGKPELEVGDDLAFNLSHSGDAGVLAVGCGQSLGVDLERHRPMENFLALARRFFSDREVAELESVEQTEQLAAFFRIWTRKEAYLKAHGTGLAARLRDFDVCAQPGSRGCLVATRPDAGECQRWALWDLNAPAGIAAALAAEGTLQEIRWQSWRLPQALIGCQTGSTSPPIR